MNKILISTLIAFALGFISSQFVSRSAQTTEVKDSSAEQCTELSAAKSDLISISQNEYLEYTQIKDMKQKYEKADEILGKVMLLFLADIGFRLQKNTVEDPIAVSVSATVQTTSMNTPALPETYNSSQNDSDLMSKSAAIKKMKSEKQIIGALDQSIIDNPKIENAKGNVLSQNQIRRFEGRYNGTIKFSDRKRENLRENLNVTWDLNIDYSKSELSGSFHLNIEGPSKNSKSNDSGYIDRIVSLSGDQEGFLVSACGDECYMQLYYNSSADQFYGNYYELLKGSKSKFQRLGIVELRK